IPPCPREQRAPRASSTRGDDMVLGTARVSTRRAAAAPAAIALVLLTTWPASGETSNAASAEALFRDGKRLLEAHDYAASCSKLAESFRLAPATGTLLAPAMCHEAQGRIATAWGEYTDAAARARTEGRSDREQGALQRAAQLEAKLSTLNIVPSTQ